MDYTAADTVIETPFGVEVTFKTVEQGEVTFETVKQGVPNDPDNADWQDYQAWLAEGNTPDPAPPPPIEYAAQQEVSALVRTTDATATEVFRFPCAQRHLYRANLRISGIDATSGAAKIMEGRFAWKRLAGNAIVIGIDVVSDIHDTAAAAWAPNCLTQGTEIVFAVQGADGRTIDWLLVGEVGRYAPSGLAPTTP